MNKYIRRNIEDSLSSLIDFFPVIMITGPRQVGKTTLLEHLLQNSDKKINYVSLDNLTLRSKAIEDPELFIKTYDTPLVIDEFQYAPNLLSYIKIKVDEARKNRLFNDGKETNGMYYLTGSEVFKTMDDVSESLAGRVGILDLYGLSARELEGKKEEMFLPDIKLIKKKEKLNSVSVQAIFERIINGGFPELINCDINMREKFFETYIRTYIERDIRKLINVKDENKFLKFIASVAVRTGQEYNAADIARDVEITSKTADKWISILKNTHLVYMLNAYSNNDLQKVIKRPKIYFMDTGLACYLAGYFSTETLIKSAYNGQIFETYVITEIIKSYANNGKDPRRRLYYYRDTNQKEIDLLVVYDNKVYPVEIKKSSNPGKAAIKNFDVVNKFGYEVGSGMVICMTSEIIAIDENNYMIPIEYI